MFTMTRFAETIQCKHSLSNKTLTINDNVSQNEVFENVVVLIMTLASIYRFKIRLNRPFKEPTLRLIEFTSSHPNYTYFFAQLKYENTV